MIYHIRKPLNPAHGNQFYKDRSDRSNGTYCGAPESDSDIKHHWPATVSNNYEPCKVCLAKRAEA